MIPRGRMSKQVAQAVEHAQRWSGRTTERAGPAAPTQPGVYTVRITGPVLPSGLWPAILCRFGPIGWEDAEVSIKVKPANEGPLLPGQRYDAVPSHFAGDDYVWVVHEPLVNLIAAPTSATADTLGTYPATFLQYTRVLPTVDPTWQTYGSLRILPLNGEAVEVDRRYLVIPTGTATTAGIPIFAAVVTCCEGEVSAPLACLKAACESQEYTFTLSGVSLDITQFAEGMSDRLNRCHRLIGFPACFWEATTNFNTVADDPRVLPGTPSFGDLWIRLAAVYTGVSTGDWVLVLSLIGLDGQGNTATYRLSPLPSGCTVGTLSLDSSTGPGGRITWPSTIAVGTTACPPPAAGCCPDTAEWCVALALAAACSDGSQDYSLAHVSGCTWEATGTDGWSMLFDPSIAYLEIYYLGDPIAGYYGDPVTNCSTAITLALDYSANTSCEFPATLTLNPGACAAPPATSFCFPGASFGVCGSFDPATLTSSGPGVFSWTNGVQDVTVTVTGGTAELTVYDGGVDGTYTCASWNAATGGTFSQSSVVPPCSYPSTIVITGGACP